VKVLIAEDFSLTAKILAKMLNNSEFIEVAAVIDNGLEVMDYLLKNYIDLLLLDITLPKFSGIQILEKLIEERLDLKVLVLSANTDHKIIRKALDLGAVGYLTKSVCISEVIDAIHAVIRGETYIDNNALQILIENGDPISYIRQHNFAF
jgi:DNA-binding NarL/FixJ family response regulator